MKEFLKWLGINEKIAKIAVWLFIFMVFLILTNVFLESIGFPYYKITAENLSKINYGKVVEFLLGCLLNILNFYSIILIIVRIKDFRETIMYSIIYLISTIIITNLFNYALCQIFIFIYIIGYLFFYGKKNWKYLIYGASSLVFNTFLQYICYMYKIKYIDFSKVGEFNRFLISIDYLIVIGLIIIIKEIYLKKRGVKNA